MAALLLRHGATALNQPGHERIRGWLDVPLSPDGVRAAHLAATRFRGLRLDGIYASDLSRAAETARIWGESAKVPVSLHPELRPWNLADLQGQSAEAMQPLLDDLVAHPSIPAPGGGESFHDFLARYLPFILPLVLDRPLHGVVTHIRNIKAVEAALIGGGDIHLPTWAQAPKVSPGQGVYLDRRHMQPEPRPAGVPSPTPAAS